VKPVLALDFDDVIFPFMQRFVPHYNERYNADFTIDDFWTFDFDKVVGGDPQIVWDRIALFFEEPVVDVEPLPGSSDGIAALADHYELAIVTSRDESLRTVTESWIEATFPGVFHSVHLCSTYSRDPAIQRRTKREVIESLHAVALVDDSLQHASSIASSGRRAFLFGEYAWNVCDVLPDGVERHVEWSTIVESLVVTA
jgi:hypothetical protein